MTFWLPQIIQSFGSRSDFEIGMLSAIPFFGAAIAMVFVGRASDLSGERRWHLAFCAGVGAIGLMLASMTHSPLLSLGALSIAAAGIWGTFGPFWAMPPEFLSGTAAAGAIALINSIGNLGGFAGPYVVGIVKQTTHSFAGGMIVMAAVVGRGWFARLDTAGAGARNGFIMSETSSALSPSAIWRQLGLEHHNWPGRFTVCS